MTQADQCIEFINEWKKSQSYFYSFYFPGHATFEFEVKQVEDEQIDSGRWTELRRKIYSCSDGSYFAVESTEPLTEMQDNDIPPEAYRVEPKEELITKFYKMK